jgi:Nif-specific regulatory protein
MERGLFREDLYYRLNVFAIRLPPLRERRDDVLPLADAFVQEIGRSIGRPPAGISREARQALLDYHWPGNVRELRNILERAAILCDGGLIAAEHLAVAPPAGSSVAAPNDLRSMERTLIANAMSDAHFNKSEAARALGLTRAQLYVRLRKHGLDKETPKSR